MEGQTPDGQRLEELGNGSAAGLRVARCARGGGLRWSVEGDPFGRFDGDIRPDCHDACFVSVILVLLSLDQ